jgi:glycosyltransferase involved in cell wall biosynthesis
LRRSLGRAGVPGGDFPGWYSKYGQHVSKRFPSEPKGPLITIVLPVYNPDLKQLEAAIESVRHQTYVNWELCIVDDCSDEPEVRRVLESYVIRDERIRLKLRTQNGHISVASNDALEMARGDYVTFLDHDDELVPWALDSVCRNIRANPKAKMLYSDEAIVDLNSKILSGHLKGGLNRTLAWSYNYFCHLTVYSKNILSQIGSFKVGLEGAQDYDLALRALEALEDSEVFHIPEVLYFWREGKASTALSIRNKPYALEAGRKAVGQHLARIGVSATVEDSLQVAAAFRVRLDVVEDENSVSVVIPTRDNIETLSVCMESILNKTDYQNYEIIIVDNGSREPKTKQYLSEVQQNARVTVLTIDLPFNYSQLNNAAAKIASGRHLLLLNDDTEVIDNDWMREMVSFSQLPFVGAVGAKLIYPDARVQHAGIILGIGSVAGHAHRFLDSKDSGYAGRAALHQEFMAVTGACLMIEREVFFQVSGLDEQLAVSLNDVDLCLRVNQLGLRNVFTPFAQLIHHESFSRGSDASPENVSRAWTEIEFMKNRWGSLLQNDPYYSINFSNSSHAYNFAYPPRLPNSANS